MAIRETIDRLVLKHEAHCGPVVNVDVQKVRNMAPSYFEATTASVVVVVFISLVLVLFLVSLWFRFRMWLHKYTYTHIYIYPHIHIRS